MSDINWQMVRADYEGGLSLRALSAKYGVSKSVIGDRKYREKWIVPDKNRTENNTQEVIRPDMNAAVRATMGFKLRYEEHLTWEEIATRAGYASRGAAMNAVKREASRHISHDIQEIREQELHRINCLQSRCYKAGIDQDNEGWAWAVDRFVALSKRKSELMGLDAKPDTIPDGTTVIREYGVEVSRV